MASRSATRSGPLDDPNAGKVENAHAGRDARDEYPANERADLLTQCRLHHVGSSWLISMLRSPNYQALGFGEADRFDIPEQGVRAAFFPLGQGAVELIQPTDPEGAIGRFMAKRGEGFHHVAYAVDDLAATLDKLADGRHRVDRFCPPSGGHDL